LSREATLALSRQATPSRVDVRGGAIVTIVGDGFVDVGEGTANPTLTYLD